MFNKKLRLQIAAMEARLEEQTGILNGFAKDIDELKDALGGVDELAEAQRQAFEEQIRKDIGFQNMMNY